MKRLWSCVVAAVGAALVSSGAALAQCVAEWQALGGARGMSAQIHAVISWDPDGAGPQREELVVGGEFTIAGGARANYVARWDGTQWRPFGTELTSIVRALTVCDPDGAGPEPQRLVAGGEFALSGTSRGVAWWDGDQWRPFGVSGGIVHALTTWDPDGPGPASAQLVVGGEHFNAGGVSMNRIARWDGSQWHAFGSGFENPVYAVTTWDPDGPGPEFPEVVAGGIWIGRWDGSQWVDIQAGLSFGRVLALATWDPDGPGPQGAQLFAGCDYSFSQWDGAEWINREPSRPVVSFAVCDLDGPGPERTQLILGGGFTRAGTVPMHGVARWDGNQVLPFPIQLEPQTAVHALATWDPDGSGPDAPQLVAGTSFAAPFGRGNGVIRWDGGEWELFDRETDSPIAALVTWDPDGPGPMSSELVAGGYFTTAGDKTVNRIARWDGVEWRPFGSGLSGGASTAVFAVTTWDPDGSGPQAPQLVAGGSFTSLGETLLNRIARWDGEQWLPLGAGMSNSVLALTTWDPDGAGPLPPQLVAGGWFRTAGEVEVNNIARWDGSQWHAMGGGADGSVSALTEWDPDAEGPEPAQLVAGGGFTIIGGVDGNSIARWNGAAWLAFGSGMSGEEYDTVNALTTWDADGAGPQLAQLVAAGRFTMADGGTVNHVAGWDGKWHPFGVGLEREVDSLMVWDPDGAEQQGPQLVAGGRSIVATSSIARWDGEGWRSVPQGPNNRVRALTIWDPDGEGPRPEHLVAGGDFNRVGARPTGYAALHGCPTCPCDWNQSGTLDSQDFFDFLIPFFAGSADFNHDGRSDSQDFFDFVDCFMGDRCRS